MYDYRISRNYHKPSDLISVIPLQGNDNLTVLLSWNDYNIEMTAYWFKYTGTHCDQILALTNVVLARYQNGAKRTAERLRNAFNAYVGSEVQVEFICKSCK